MIDNVISKSTVNIVNIQLKNVNQLLKNVNEDINKNNKKIKNLINDNTFTKYNENKNIIRGKMNITSNEINKDIILFKTDINNNIDVNINNQKVNVINENNKWKYNFTKEGNYIFEIIFNNNINNMKGFFYEFSNIISLDFSNFNTSNVTNLSFMVNEKAKQISNIFEKNKNIFEKDKPKKEETKIINKFNNNINDKSKLINNLIDNKIKESEKPKEEIKKLNINDIIKNMEKGKEKEANIFSINENIKTNDSNNESNIQKSKKNKCKISLNLMYEDNMYELDIERNKTVETLIKDLKKKFKIFKNKDIMVCSQKNNNIEPLNDDFKINECDLNENDILIIVEM